MTDSGSPRKSRPWETGKWTHPFIKVIVRSRDFKWEMMVKKNKFNSVV